MSYAEWLYQTMIPSLCCCVMHRGDVKYEHVSDTDEVEDHVTTALAERLRADMARINTTSICIELQKFRDEEEDRCDDRYHCSMYRH